ncbi:hypothetical protein [Thermoflexus sp.]|uniref:hypothetical protein n=1 Tax=Thermoflexus sp. TaxID=1969742 RepID=UPI002ADD69C2|nr:hypothetical protein [Thermoflexus sp.]
MKSQLTVFLVISVLLSCSQGKDLKRSPISPVAHSSVSIHVSVPTPVPGTGNLIGRLRKSADGLELFLAEHIGRTDEDMIYGLDVNNAPKATIYNDNLFLFLNVKPGKYMVVLWSPAVSYSVKLVEVLADRTVDVGEISP